MCLCIREYGKKQLYIKDLLSLLSLKAASMTDPPEVQTLSQGRSDRTRSPHGRIGRYGAQPAAVWLQDSHSDHWSNNMNSHTLSPRWPELT